MQENRIKRIKMAIVAEAVLCMAALAGIFSGSMQSGEKGRAGAKQRVGASRSQ